MELSVLLLLQCCPIMSHHSIDRITPLMAFYGALWHIGRKRVRYDNDGVFGILFFESASGYEGEE